MASFPHIIVASEDRDRLLLLVERGTTKVAEQLDVELARARVLPRREVPADVVVMNSEIEYEDTAGRRHRVRLVYPDDVAEGRVSVMAPLGCALLGLRAGQEIDWHMPGGPRRLRVLAVTQEPEPEWPR